MTVCAGDSCHGGGQHLISVDYRAWRPPQGALLKTQENTILGHMSGEHVSFIVWLHATTLIRDGIAGRWDSEEAHFYFRLALTTMREASQRPVQDYTDTFLGAMGCFTACAVSTWLDIGL